MRRVYALILLFILTSADMGLPGGQGSLQLDAPTVIRAGDAWELHVSVAGADAGESVELLLLNGLQPLSTALTLGTGGVAVWRIPAGQLTQAGTSLVVVRRAAEETQLQLRVLPGPPDTADLFTTGNALPAHGAGSVSLLLLPRDAWGNPPPDTQPFTVQARFPDGTRAALDFEYRGGLGWFELFSQGGPGRVRLLLDEGQLAAELELLQTPGHAARVTLDVQPACLPDDGRDIIELTAQVDDAHRQPSADGTLVQFQWDDGFGYGRTINGQAVLRLPAPAEVGIYSFSASVGSVRSERDSLRVTGGNCP